MHPAQCSAAFRLISLFLALLAGLRWEPAVAQQADFATAQQKALERNLAGDFEGALQWAEYALTIAAQKGGSESVDAASAHLSIAIQRQSLGQLQVAEQHYRKGLAIQEKLVPADDYSLSPYVAGLGGLLFGQGRYDAAAPFMRTSIALQ